MKKTLLFILCISVTCISFAQKFNLGIKAGANFPSPKYERTGVSNVNGKMALNLGAFATIGALGFNVQPELNYSQINFDYTEASAVKRFKQTYLAIPVLFKFNIPLSGFGLYAGPQYSNLLSAKDNDVDVKSTLSSSEWAAVFGADFKIPLTKIIISARYQAGITDVATSSAVKLKNNLATVSVGLKL
jgi:hypothetical protein